MDEDYARLSLEIGMIVGAIDVHLGYSHFIPRIREKAWALTAVTLDEIRAEARSLGVPENLLWLTDEQKAELPRLLSIGIVIQRNVDGGTVH